MVQVPPCSCNQGGSAGGGGTCASVVVTPGYCADDITSRPLIARTVILCDGNVIAGIYEPDGTEYLGSVKRCDPQCCPDTGTAGSSPTRYEALLHSELTLDNVTAQTLDPAPLGTDFVHIENPPRGSSMARWKDDGVDPVAGLSDDAHYVNQGVWFEYSGDFDAIKFISDTSIGSRIIYTYYRYI